MRILLVHNYYGSSAPSGENKAFEAERAMLEKYGHEVVVYTRHSDEIRGDGNGELGTVRQVFGMVKGALCTVGNPFAARALAKMCREFKPDIVHFHNTFPLISPLSVRAASRYAPVVMTLHNYRTVCAAGVPTRAGKVCSLCLDKKCVWDGVRYRCYRGSLAATLPLAVNISLYRQFLPKWVARFIVLSEFQKRKMVEYGWPEEKIEVKGNFVSRVEHAEHVEKKNQVVYVGRLSEEKGVETFIKALGFLEEMGLKGVIVGEGADRNKYESIAKEYDIEFIGQKPSEEARRIIRESKVLVSPSTCWETFGLSAVEAMMEGVPSVVSKVGALPNVVENGRFGEVFEAGNAEACAVAIKRLLKRSDYDEMSVAAKHEAERKYSEASNYAQLMNIYLRLQSVDG